MSDATSIGTRALVDELVHAYPFPDPRRADRRGMLAYGGDLEPERLLSAYAQGIFPWYDEEPILWYSPDPRMVLRPDELHVGRSLRKRIRARPFELSMDQAFGEVIHACSLVPRPGQQGTWITQEMIAAYRRLHTLGFAHSVEAWERSEAGERRLAGGLYGVSLGQAFFGESMFARAEDASKIAFVALVQQVREWCFDFVDCQVRTEHLARFGAREWRRREFLSALEHALEADTRRGAWAFSGALEV